MIYVRTLMAVACLVLSAPMAVAQDKFFDSHGVKIRYVESGSGAPMVLLHGAGGSLETWIDTGRFADLAASYHVIAFDLRGHGRSGKPHDPKQYGAEMALDVVRLLDHLNIERAHIVGYSLGAIVTAQLLTLNPERFLTATLVAGAGRFEWNDELARAAEQEASERERDCNSRSLTTRLAPPGQPPSEADLKARSAACFANPDNDRFAMAALARSRADQVFTTAKAAAVKVPTLGIVGTLDPNLAGLQTLKTLRADLRLVSVEGATHGGDRGILRRPELLITIREFLAAHRQTSSR
jgi:pimeloyl-ACP methyl ester carboxylesterase